MKRLITIAILAAFILGIVSMAHARHQPAPFQPGARGDWQMSLNYVENPTFDSDSDIDKFQAVQRLRTAFEFMANENLRAVFRLHVENRWGQEAHGFGVTKGTAATGDTIGYDLAFLDIFIPNTDVNLKVGKQLLTLPGTVGSHILDNFAYSIVASTPFTDMFGLTAGWARLSDESATGIPGDEYSKDEADLFFALVPITLDGMRFTPHLTYVRHQENADLLGVGQDTDQDIFWAGLNFAVTMLDPITIRGDFNYGASDKAVSGTNIGETRGWIAALAVDYQMDMFTPRIYALYESGESSSSLDDDSRGKIMPNLGSGDLWGMSSFGFNGSQFRGNGRARINALQGNAAWGATGKMALGLKLMDISFMDKLNHEFQAVYYRGTNHKDGRDLGLLTTRDAVWEANFNTTYMMYENLAAILELGYMDADLSEDNTDRDTDAAWKAAAGFRYRF